MITTNELFSSELATPEIYLLDNFQTATHEQIMTDNTHDNIHYYGISDEDVENDVELVNAVKEDVWFHPNTIMSF